MAWLASRRTVQGGQLVTTSISASSSAAITRSISSLRLGQQRQIVHPEGPRSEPGNDYSPTAYVFARLSGVSREVRRGNLPRSATTLVGRDGAAPRSPH